MYHHLQRARDIYNSKGIKNLIKTSVTYAPIELNNLLFRLHHGSGTHVMNEDWDTLILLDGCRFDMFQEQNWLDGTLEYRISLGSTSEEFFQQNFSGSTYHDTVYINSNAYLPKLGMYEDETFHAIVDLLDEWDKDIEVVHPRTVVEAAKRADDEFPNKRLIIHFMQPHYPFIGEHGQRIQNQIEDRSVWRSLRKQQTELDLRQVWQAYRENLDIALTHVEDLLQNLDGKTIVSADHGNMVGERQGQIPTRRLYGHYWGIYTQELLKVPWLVCEHDDRKQIHSGPPKAINAKPDEVVQDRLETLGYAD